LILSLARYDISTIGGLSYADIGTGFLSGVYKIAEEFLPQQKIDSYGKKIKSAQNTVSAPNP